MEEVREDQEEEDLEEGKAEVHEEMKEKIVDEEGEGSGDRYTTGYCIVL